MRPISFEPLPSSPSVPEHEQIKRSGDAWMEKPSVFEQAREDVGEIFSALQQRGGTGIYDCLPLSERRMKGFVRMFLKGVESGRGPEDIRSDAEDGVRRMSRAARRRERKNGSQ